MTFEEVLPLMKQGKVAVLDGSRYRFQNGEFVSNWKGGWDAVYISFYFLVSQDWEIEKVEVKKWQWVFGRGNSALFQTSLYHSEESAEKKREQHGCDWKYPIPPTEIESDQD